MTDLLLRQVQASRAGAQGDDDYDVIGSRGLVIGRIFKGHHIACGDTLDVDAGRTFREEPSGACMCFPSGALI